MTRLCLVVTCEPACAEPYRRELGARGLKPYFVHTLSSALAVQAQWHFDAIVVHGFGFMGLAPMVDELSRRSAAPILLVLAAAEEEEQVRILESGAAEVVVEPVSVRLLCARLTRLIELAQPRPESGPRHIRLGPLDLDPRRAAATVDGTRLSLTPGEFELLSLLASRPDEFVHREAIARTLGANGSSESRRSADMHVCRIRRKLREAGAHRIQLETIYGRGYMLRLEPPQDARAGAAQVAEWSV